MIAFLEREDKVRAFLDDLRGFLGRWLPEIRRENRSYLTVAIGCTGGRHRSVAMAEALAKALRGLTGVRLRVRHRDVANA